MAQERPLTHRQLRENIPSRYNPYLYFGFTNLFVLIVIVAAASRLQAVQLWEWLALPVAFLSANYFEYRVHKGPMHHEHPWAKILFKRHTRQHHRFFSAKRMGMAHKSEAYLVLFPFWAVFLLLGNALLLYLLARALFGENVALFCLIMSVGYYLLYEWLHLLYHFPAGSFIGRRTLITYLRCHHQRHHEPAGMTRYNFNITFPIFDNLLGTHYDKAQRRTRASAGHLRSS